MRYSWKMPGLDEAVRLTAEGFRRPVPDVLYISGTLIESARQGTGIKAAGTMLAFERYPSLRWLAGRTQSSVVWASAARVSSELTPNRDASPFSAEGTARMNALVAALRMSGPTHAGFYGGPLYGEKPTHRDPAVQAWWDTRCDFERGDAVLYLGRYRR